MEIVAIAKYVRILFDDFWYKMQYATMLACSRTVRIDKAYQNIIQKQFWMILQNTYIR